METERSGKFATSMFAGAEMKRCSLSSRKWNCVNQSV